MAELFTGALSNRSTLPHPDIEPVEEELRSRAIHFARGCGHVPARRYSPVPRAHYAAVSTSLRRLQKALYNLKTAEPSDDLRWLFEHMRLVNTDIEDSKDAVKSLARQPQVRTAEYQVIPRCYVYSRDLLEATHHRLTAEYLATYLAAAQTVEPLTLAEIWAVIPSLKLALLTALSERGWQAYEHSQAAPGIEKSFQIGRLITSLRLLGDLPWKEFLEPLMVVDRTLREDPSGVYPRMNYDTRDTYRRAVAEFGGHSDRSEVQIAQLVVQLARNGAGQRDVAETTHDRLRHVGHYLVGKGQDELAREIEYRPSLSTRFERFLRRFPDEYYIIGIEFLTLVTVCALIMRLVEQHAPAGILASALFLLLPATQAAVEVMNYLTTALIRPRQLPKLDFSEGVPPECATIVAVPTLLITEAQVRQLVEDLEVRFLANRDANIHYALLTDLPDSPHTPNEADPLLDLAIRLINDLDTKYGRIRAGGFFLFHRHRVYNPREGAWMGWERKRGKLLDLNQFLRGAYDPFPVKTGDFARLRSIRYVITLDSDTQLPRGSAVKMIGTMAHPLNRPVIDHDRNIVVDGYGILQPRVGISVQSATRSRLAQIYSGETGFDIYSRAVSDVYQDLYDEGIFTGKGIYDVDALRQVLEHRFPRNALLSHDLIEGAYSRAGLLSDVEVIDDYPSHYSAYNRRKHRWLRGDWQIVRWIFNWVPDETRQLVRNPISTVSRWKILDNLRRSLIEPGTFFLLLAGWLVLPGTPLFWTAVTLALLFLPTYFQLIFSLARAVLVRRARVARNALATFLTSHINILLAIAFLAHQTLVALDAIVRTVVRSNITHSRLLEWETATEAELGIRKRTPVDIYLDWIPVLSLVLAAALYFRPAALPYAAPFLLLWAFSKWVTRWINRSPHTEEQRLGTAEIRFLRDCALRTWRYFRDFSTEANHWLVPDNVQLEPYRRAERSSTTNIGLLLNARQAALEFGYLTLPEFIGLTSNTLETMTKLARHRGQYFNWYDNLTLAPLEPLFVSTVDNGNLCASLWSLKQGCLDLLEHQPLLRPSLKDGLLDHFYLYEAISGARHSDRVPIERENTLNDTWLTAVLARPLGSVPPSPSGHQSDEAEYWAIESRRRREALHRFASDFLPWLLPRFEPLRRLSSLNLLRLARSMNLKNAGAVYQSLDNELRSLACEPDLGHDLVGLIGELRGLLPGCREHTASTSQALRKLAAVSDELVEALDFGLLADKHRRLLAVGYDAAEQKISPSCYDLLASESRIATFIAIAKEDVLQEHWFRLGRQHTIAEGESVLVSWTGTMFEYLMPALWMKSHANTLLDRSVRAATRVQMAYAGQRRVPWGISEAAYSEQDADGNYQYAAFGVPSLALNVVRAGSLVISPYSSFLALGISAPLAVENLRRMARKGWIGEYGFFESADYRRSERRLLFAPRPTLIRSWMVHHHGMSLLALANLFHENVFQRWFHSEPRVQATELLLQERPLRVRPIADVAPRRFVPQLRRDRSRAAVSGAA